MEDASIDGFSDPQDAARLAAAASQMPAVLWATDRELRIEWVAGGGQRLLGVDIKQFVGRKVPEVLRGPPSAHRLEVYQRALEGMSGQYDVPVINRTWSVRVSPLRGEGENIIGTVGTAVDVTLHKQAQTAVQSSETRYRMLFEHSPISLWEMDFSGVKRRLKQLRAQGVQDFEAHFRSSPEEVARCIGQIRVLDTNRATLRLFEAASREELQRNFDKIFTVESYNQLRADLLDIVAGHRSCTGEGECLTLTGKPLNIMVRWEAAPHHEDDLTNVLVSIVDTTELRRAHAELEERRRQSILHRAESMAITSRLAAGVAHEINNPLQAIMAHMQMLTEDLPEPFRTNKRLQGIRTAVDQIAGITGSLLDLCRDHEGAAGECPVARVLGDVTQLVSAFLHKANISLEIEAADPAVTVPLEACALTEVLLNLILNAHDAMPSGGAIRIRAEKREDSVHVTVSDNGTGIAAEDLPRIFSPYFTTKGKKGTGMGLSITHAIITGAGGCIDVESRKGNGATFSIRLPAGK